MIPVKDHRDCEKVLEIDDTEIEDENENENEVEQQDQRDQQQQRGNETITRYFLGPVENLRIGDDENALNNTSAGNSVPGVERINRRSLPLSLPVAYPVPLREPEAYPVNIPSTPVGSPAEQQRQEQQEIEGDTQSIGEKKKCSFKSLLFTGILSLVILVTVLLKVYFSKANLRDSKPIESSSNNQTSSNQHLHHQPKDYPII